MILPSSSGTARKQRAVRSPSILTCQTASPHVYVCVVGAPQASTLIDMSPLLLHARHHLRVVGCCRRASPEGCAPPSASAATPSSGHPESGRRPCVRHFPDHSARTSTIPHSMVSFYRDRPHNTPRAPPPLHVSVVRVGTGLCAAAHWPACRHSCSVGRGTAPLCRQVRIAFARASGPSCLGSIVAFAHASPEPPHRIAATHHPLGARLPIPALNSRGNPFFSPSLVTFSMHVLGTSVSGPPWILSRPTLCALLSLFSISPRPHLPTYGSLWRSPPVTAVRCICSRCPVQYPRTSALLLIPPLPLPSPQPPPDRLASSTLLSRLSCEHSYSVRPLSRVHARGVGCCIHAGCSPLASHLTIHSRSIMSCPLHPLPFPTSLLLIPTLFPSTVPLPSHPHPTPSRLSPLSRITIPHHDLASPTLHTSS
jgi:hypothetical protein